MAREASPETLFIRQLVDEDPNVTFNDALPAIRAKKYDINTNTFNVVKSTWKKRKAEEAALNKGKPGRRPSQNKDLVMGNPQEVTALIDFVQKQGGITAVQAGLTKKKEDLEALQKEISSLEAVVTSFGNLQSVVSKLAS